MSIDVDREFVARRWSNRGFSCELWVDPPGQVWADFVHGVDELVMVAEGAVSFEIGGVVHEPPVGEELLIPARTNHTVRNLGASVSRWLYGYKR